MKDKNVLENDIIKKIYDESCFFIIKSERPDFILRSKSNSNLLFGVEVTQFFLNQSTARLKNIEGYYDLIFDKKKYHHKDDEINIPVNKITLISPENKQYTVDAIFKSNNLQDYSDSLLDIIEIKDEKIKYYDLKCSYHNLIIYDQENFIIKKTNNKPILNIDKKIFDSIKKNNFREIFLITNMDSDLEIYIPLKLFLISYELRLLKYYETIKKELFVRIKQFNKNIFFYLLLLKKGYKNILLLFENDKFEVQYSRYIIHIGKNKIEIKFINNEINCRW